MPWPEVVLFDLDGTLVDSAPGMLASIRHAFVEHGQPPLDDGAVRRHFGPPIRDWLPAAVPDPDRAGAIIASYRAHYAAGGSLDTAAYPGVAALLDELAGRGTRLAVATSKLEPSAVQILESLDLIGRFETVCGDTAEGARGTKTLVVTETLRRLGRPDPRSVLMIGDREHDVIGARANGLRCGGAGWGYGSPGELAAAGAEPIWADVAELADFLRAPGAWVGTDAAAS